VVLVGPGGAGGAFGWALASAGDVNGDGHADLVVSANGAASQAGRVYLYLAHAGSYGPAPDATLSGTDGPGEQFGLAVACANDVNADGYADVVVGSLGGSNHAGRIYLYLGSAGGLATSPQAVIDGPDGAAGVFGRAVAHRGSRRHSSAS
jgi:hypothetical protein